MGAGGVAAGVEDAVAAVRRLAAERDLAVGAVERHAEAHEVVDAVGGRLDEDARRLLVDEAGAGLERVAQVQLRARRPAPTAAAMPPCAYFVLHSSMLPLVSTQHGAVLARQQRGVEPGDAGADDDVVEALGHGVPPPRPGQT